MQVRITDPRNEADSFTLTMLTWGDYAKGTQLRFGEDNRLRIEVVDEHNGVLRRHDDEAYFGNLHAKQLGLSIIGGNDFWREINKRLKELMEEEYSSYQLHGTFTDYKSNNFSDLFYTPNSYKIIPYEKEPDIVPRFFTPYQAVPPLDYTKLKDKRSKFDFDSVLPFADERVGIRVVQNGRTTYESPKHRPLTHNGLGQRKFNYNEPSMYTVQVKPRQVGSSYTMTSWENYLLNNSIFKDDFGCIGFTKQYKLITNEKERFIEDLAWFTINRFSDKG